MARNRDQAVDVGPHARTRPGTLRRVLFDRIVDLLLGDAPPDETERRALLDTLARLLPTVSVDERKTLAIRLTQTPDPPAELVGLLARDDIEVARLILESAVALEPQALKLVADQGTDAHRLALAGRANLAAPVTELLIEHGNEAVVRRLVANSGAAFSLTSLARLAADFRHIEAVEAFLNQSLGTTVHDPGAAEVAAESHAEPAARTEQGAEDDRKEAGVTPAPEAQAATSAPEPSPASDQPPIPLSPRQAEDESETEIIDFDQVAPAGRALRDSLLKSATEAVRTGDFARAAADWSWETDANGRLVFLSDHAITAFGLPAAAVRGARLTEYGRFLPDGSRYRDAGQAMARKIPFREAPFEARAEGGGRTKWMLNGVPLFDLPTGAFRGYRGTAVEHTVIEALESADDRVTDELNQKLSELEEHNLRLSGQLEATHEANVRYADRLAGLTHELRTPLNAIIGFSEIIAGTTAGTDEEKYHAPAQAIRDAAWQLNSLVGDVLTNARVDAAVLKVDNKPFLLDAVVDRVIAEVLDRAKQRGLSINLTRLGSGLEITADEDWVTEVIRRLLRHAVDEAPRGSAIALHVAPNDGGAIQITVRCDAPCPPGGPEDLFRKLEPLAGHSPNRMRIGRAFSLALARDIARYIGGDLRAEGDDHETCFHYSLAS